jgi:hypothetical protein
MAKAGDEEKDPSLEIKTVSELIDLVKQLKFLGVTQFKIGDIAMDITGDSFPQPEEATEEEIPDEELLYYSS